MGGFGKGEFSALEVSAKTESIAGGEIIPHEVWSEQVGALREELKKALCGANNEKRAAALNGAQAELVAYVVDGSPSMSYRWSDGEGSYAATHESLVSARAIPGESTYAMFGMAPDGRMQAYVETKEVRPARKVAGKQIPAGFVTKGAGVSRELSFDEESPNAQIELTFAPKASESGEVTPDQRFPKHVQVSRLLRTGPEMGDNTPNPEWDRNYKEMHAFRLGQTQNSSAAISTIA